jgi:hypothetical protein
MRDSRPHPTEHSLDTRFDAAFQRGYDSTEGFVSVRAPSAGTDEFAQLTNALGGPGPSGQGAMPRVRNPFVAALWTVAAVLFALGVLALFWSNSTFLDIYRSSAGDPGYVFAVLASALAPWLISIGMATAIGVLFLQAYRWAAGR